MHDAGKAFAVSGVDRKFSAMLLTDAVDYSRKTAMSPSGQFRLAW